MNWTGISFDGKEKSGKQKIPGIAAKLKSQYGV
jgi:hypothetical protein